jgi:hypothetical protein
VKTFLIRLFIFFPVLSFYSCGNGLLDFLNEDTPGGEGGGGPMAGTTGAYVPVGTTPIYIDTQNDFFMFCNYLGKMVDSSQGIKYPADGYYILRGNDVPDRTFYTQTAINSQTEFTGTLTGWFMPDEEHEDMKTTIKIDMPFSLFLGNSMQAKTVSWLKFEAVHSNSYGAADAVGIVAAEAKNTRFEQVTVVGKVDVSSHNWTNVVYVGGIVGKAGGSTVFEWCRARANISVKLESSSNSECYIGGIAGLMEGSVVNSGIATMQKNSNPPYAPMFGSITVSSTIDSGNSKVYAGGVAGKLIGQGHIETTVVRAKVAATGQEGNAYSGGYVGLAEGTINNNTSGGELTVEATSGVTSSGNAFAGGLAGELAQGTVGAAVITNNHLTGTVSVTSKYYNGASYSGGLVGSLSGTAARIENSSINGSATIQSYSQANPASSPGKAYAGGLAGYSAADCTITESSFSSSSYYGAVIAGFSNSNGQLGPIAALEAYAGGIAGHALGKISKVYSNAQTSETDTSSSTVAGIDARTSEASGTAAAGGIAGQTETEISESYAVVTVKVRAKDGTGVTASAGGIAGISSADITNTFALAKIDARPEPGTATNLKVYGGGIVGQFSNASATSPFSVKNSYAAGAVLAFADTSNAYAGGIAGYALGAATNKATFEACVALQQFVASNGSNHNRVIGELTGTSENSKCYAYENMKSQYSGGNFSITGTGNAADATGANISATNAKDINYYTGTDLSWNSSSATWIKGSNTYPVLDNLTPPSYTPTWADIQ